jgi:hypothetical protein
MNAFYNTYLDIIKSIDELLEERRIVPCLMLLYSAIDGFSFLAEKTNKRGRQVFKNWVKEWMLRKYPLTCKEEDLYAARCSLIHNQTSESQLSIEGKAKMILYAWGNAKLEDLQLSISNSNKDDGAVAVKLEDLIYAFKNGLSDCISEIEKDENWRTNFDEKAKKMFVNINIGKS